MWADELRSLDEAPFRTDPRALMVCFSASVELSCFHALQWPEPHHLCDLFLKSDASKTVQSETIKPGTYAVMKRYGLDAMSSSEKEGNKTGMRNVPENSINVKNFLLIMSLKIPLYRSCFKRCYPESSTTHSYFRSGYAKAVARTEFLGIPLNSRSTS